MNDTKPDLPWKKPSLETFLGSIKNCFLWIVGFLRPVLGRYGMMSWGTKWVSLVMMKSWLLLYGRGCDWSSFLHLFPLHTLHNDEGLGEWCHFSLKKSKLPQPQKTTRQFIPQYDPIWWTISPWERTFNFEILFLMHSRKRQFKSSLFLQTLESIADPVWSYIFESKATEWHCNGGHSKEY